MPHLSLGRSICREEKVGAAGNNTFSSLYLFASSAALCWRRRVRRLIVNSTLNFMLSTKKVSNLERKSQTVWISVTKKLKMSLLNISKKNLYFKILYYMVLYSMNLTLNWSPVWHYPAAHCEHSHGTSPLFLLQDTPAAHLLVAQMGGSQTHQVPGRWTRTSNVLQCNLNNFNFVFILCILNFFKLSCVKNVRLRFTL